MKQPQEDYKQKTCPVCGKVFFLLHGNMVLSQNTVWKIKEIPMFMEMLKRI